MSQLSSTIIKYAKIFGLKATAGLSADKRAIVVELDGVRRYFPLSDPRKDYDSVAKFILETANAKKEGATLAPAAARPGSPN